MRHRSPAVSMWEGRRFVYARSGEARTLIPFIDKSVYANRLVRIEVMPFERPLVRSAERPRGKAHIQMYRCDACRATGRNHFAVPWLQRMQIMGVLACLCARKARYRISMAQVRAVFALGFSPAIS
jgi:hypothetical protein